MIDKDAIENLLHSTVELNRAQRELTKALQQLDQEYSAEAETAAMDAEAEFYAVEDAYQAAAELVSRNEEDTYHKEMMYYGRLFT